MKGKALSNEVARKVVEQRRQGRPYRLLRTEVDYTGTGDAWDESKADHAANELRCMKVRLQDRGMTLTANTFDKDACAILHRILELPNNLVASDGFWRWLAVEKFPDIIEARHVNLSRGTLAHPGNYGINASVTRNRVAILWFRAEMVYDSDSADPYHLAKQPGHTDFWESGIIRPRYAWCRNLARQLVKFQYRDPTSDRAYLHSTSPDGVRELYKRLRRLHAIVSYEFLSDEELQRLLADASSNLKRA